jgi:hypothetical protein
MQSVLDIGEMPQRSRGALRWCRGWQRRSRDRARPPHRCGSASDGPGAIGRGVSRRPGIAERADKRRANRCAVGSYPQLDDTAATVGSVFPLFDHPPRCVARPRDQSRKLIEPQLQACAGRTFGDQVEETPARFAAAVRELGDQGPTSRSRAIATRGSSKKLTVFPAVVSRHREDISGVARSGKLQLGPCNCSTFRAGRPPDPPIQFRDFAREGARRLAGGSGRGFDTPIPPIESRGSTRKPVRRGDELWKRPPGKVRVWERFRPDQLGIRGNHVLPLASESPGRAHSGRCPGC